MRAGWALAALLAIGCVGPGGVARVADGELHHGREIEAEAYASYFRAATLEATGDRKQALDELERALDADPDSPQILTRVAELACFTNPRLSPTTPAVSAATAEHALQLFSRALDKDARYAPAWLGRAVCLEGQGRRREALSMATRAAALDPLRAESTRVMVRLLTALDRREDAARWLNAYRVLVPAPLDQEPPTGDSAVDAADANASRALERAFSDRDLAAARAAALELRMSRSALALALATAAPELGIEQALTILAADPTDSDALVAALSAADRLGDGARFEQALRLFAGEPLPLSPRGKELFAEVLERHTGSVGLEAWRGTP